MPRIFPHTDRAQADKGYVTVHRYRTAYDASALARIPRAGFAAKPNGEMPGEVPDRFTIGTLGV